MLRAIHAALLLLAASLLVPSLAFHPMRLSASLAPGRLGPGRLRPICTGCRPVQRTLALRMCEKKDGGPSGELDFSALQRRISEVKISAEMEEERQAGPLGVARPPPLRAPATARPGWAS
jgi:hypothetical protein